MDISFKEVDYYKPVCVDLFNNLSVDELEGIFKNIEYCSSSATKSDFSGFNDFVKHLILNS